jgi:ribosomal protein S18 acetylase RimI-like enzyme
MTVPPATLRIVERLPTPEEFNDLRAAIGWPVRDPEAIHRGLQQSLFSVCAVEGERVVGYARVIGDGGLYFYLQDFMVRPEHQRQGIGSQLMDRVMGFLQAAVPDGSFVGLMAAQGASGFYERYGFEERPDGRPGMQRWWKHAR